MFVAPPLLALDQGRIRVVPEAREELSAIGVARLEDALRFRDGTVARSAGPRCTWRVQGPRGGLYLKVHRDLPWREAWFGGRRSPARREWDRLQELAAAGFAVPEALAYGECAAGLGPPRQSFLLTREVPGPPLDRFLDGAPPPQALADLAALIRRFHASGYFHRDLYCGHILVAPGPGWGRPVLLDVARVGRQQPLRRRWRVKDLAALEYSAPAALSRSRRLRFLLRYLGKERVDGEVRALLAAIARKLRRIRSHRPRYG